MNTAALAATANETARLSRRGGAPLLTADSDPGTVTRWLQWCDPNGIHAAELMTNEAEGFEPYDAAGAWQALDDMIAE